MEVSAARPHGIERGQPLRLHEVSVGHAARLPEADLLAERLTDRAHLVGHRAQGGGLGLRGAVRLVLDARARQGRVGRRRERKEPSLHEIFARRIAEARVAPRAGAVGHDVGRFRPLERADVDDGTCVEVDELRGIEDFRCERVHGGHALREVAPSVCCAALALDAEGRASEPLEDKRPVGQRRLHRKAEAAARGTRARLGADRALAVEAPRLFV